MKPTRQHRREARLLWQHVSVNGIPDADRIRDVLAAIRQRAGRDTEAVLRCFVQRLAIYIRSNQINFVSDTPLSPAQQEEMAARVAGPGASPAGIAFSVDPSVIGGIRMERGYQVTDGTIARQLEILRDKLLTK